MAIFNSRIPTWAQWWAATAIASRWASLRIDGKTYQIPINNGPNALHGGPKGFDQYVWQSHEVPDGVEFTHVSPDGDMGFPGTLTATVRYTLKGDTLRIDYTATTDKARC